MIFHATHHAEKRMNERRIPYPRYSMNLKPAGKKIKRKIRELCPRHGIVSSRIYWTHNNRFIYICEVLAAGRYLIVTAFDLNSATK